MPQKRFLLLSVLWFASAVPVLAGDAVLDVSGTTSGTKKEQWSVHGQTTVVGQGDPAFRARYSGPQSLRAGGEFRETVSATLFLGARLWNGASVYLDPEFTQGTGLSHNFGMGGYPNGEAVNGNTEPVVNIARLYLQQIIALGDETEPVEPDKDQLAGTRPVRRLTLTLGKVPSMDFFDNNTYTHDPRTQFLNFALNDGGAWDNQGDAQGYSYGFVADYNEKDWAVRIGTFMEPRVAGGFALDKQITKANGTNLEFERRYEIANHPGRARLLGFINFNRAARYRAAIDNDSTDLAAYRHHSKKAGVALSVEQEITCDLGAFLRASWNDGKTESWVFTEIDRSIALGLSLKGTKWNRPEDVLAIGGIINGLSSPHREFLANGGMGPIELGDGKLNYAPEQILELTYSCCIAKGTSIAADCQFANHPGYNEDRGPANIFAARLHYEF